MKKPKRDISKLAKDFNKLAKPLIKYLAENFDHHTKIIITPTTAELMQSGMNTGNINDLYNVENTEEKKEGY